MLGVIARVDARGLGNQTWEVCRALEPDRILVVLVESSEAQGFTPDLERFPDALVVTVNEAHWTLPEAEVRDWLTGLDVVYSAETLYDWRVADWARDAHCATVVHVNPEFYRHHVHPFPEPDAWWSATDWRIHHLATDTIVVPMPAPTDRFPQHDGSTRVLHVAGRVATGDRNGTDLVAAARDLGLPVTVRSQTALSQSHTPHTADYWTMYEGSGVLLLPRRYGGLCLPAIEASAAGLVPVMADTTPNAMWPGPRIPATRGRDVHLPGGRIETFDCAPEAIVETVNDTLDNIDEHRAAVAEWVDRNSWDALTPTWLDHLDRATRVKPRRATTVTVVVPFTPGLCEQRDRVWEWVRSRYEECHPSWPVVVAPHTGPWSKGAAVASVIDGIDTDVVIVADADCIVEPADLASAVARIRAGAPWVVPHDHVLRLDQPETERALRSRPRTPDIVRSRKRQRRRYYRGVTGGGIVVLPRSAWDVAPLDARFAGWGYEDVCWGMALDTLVGDHVRLGGDLIHLWHPPQPNQASPSQESEALHQAYIAAMGLPRRMAAVVAGDDHDVTRLPDPVRFRADVRIMRIGGLRLQFHNGEIEVSDADLVDALRRRADVVEVG